MAQKKQKDNTVLWWIAWIVLTIVSFFICSTFWTGIIARYVGTMDKPGVPIIWVAAVFGSWMILLVPLIIVMYNKVDRSYEDGRIARETRAFERAKADVSEKTVFLDQDERQLTAELKKKLKNVPKFMRRGHLVNVTLRDGRRVPNVFIVDKQEIVGIYDYQGKAFPASDIADLEACDVKNPPVFAEEKWIRLDGVGAKA